MSQPLTVIAYLRARPGLEEQVRNVLKGLVAPTRSETGCLNYDLHESLDEPGLFVFHENWTSRAHLDAHLQAPHLQALAARVDELLVEPPNLTLCTRLP